MIDFVQLKKVAQEAQESQVPFTINSTQILELLAIQAQLVEALKLTLPDIETAEDIQRKANKKGSRHVTKARIVRAAVAAAGAQP